MGRKTEVWGQGPCLRLGVRTSFPSCGFFAGVAGWPPTLSERLSEKGFLLRAQQLTHPCCNYQNWCDKQVDLYALMWQDGTNTSGWVWCFSDYALIVSTSHRSQRADRPHAQMSCCKTELDKFTEEIVWHSAKKSIGTNFTSDILLQLVYYSDPDIKWQRWHSHQNETEYHLKMAKSIILEFCYVISL